jgi:hypothetical protein
MACHQHATNNRGYLQIDGDSVLLGLLVVKTQSVSGTDLG